MEKNKKSYEKVYLIEDMLTFLTVKNFALIESLELDFTDGFNVLTGETGAGKSILIKALALLQGQKSSLDFIREKSEFAEVQATFVNPSKALKAILKEKEIELTEENELIVKRIINKNGQSRVLVNGSVVSLQVLKQIMNETMEICGQHDNQKLLDSSYQLDMVDEYGQLLDDRQKIQELVKKLNSLRKQKKELEMDSGTKVQKMDYMKFQIQEIKASIISPEEEVAMEESLRKALGSKDLIETCAVVEKTLYGEEYSVVSSLERLQNFLKASIKHEPLFQEHMETVEGVVSSLEDLGRFFGKYNKSLNADEKSIQLILDKSEAIKKLKRKYGSDLVTIKEKFETLKKDLKDLENLENTLKELDKQIKATLELAQKEASALSLKRQAIAKTISKAVTKELHELNMSSATFELKIQQEELKSTGIDNIQIMIAPNKGEGLKPLDKIASGGELSRVMLALTRTLTEKTSLSLYIFDEVDAGISGDTGLVVGRKLQEVSKTHQVLCITHLPQVAIFGRNHLVVSKKEQKGRTVSEISPITEDQRIQEVARMLGGGIAKKEAVENAKAMLSAANS